MTDGARPLPDGRLVVWYGDDFTGSAAVMEALTFGGLEAVLFLDVPTANQLARFPGVRGVGIAGIARSQGPAWMDRELPPIFRALVALGSPVIQYKICSTFDSAPDTGSIGKAIELGLPIVGATWVPLLAAAPPIHRYQAFGNLFAPAGGSAYRLDRHPTMSRHPVTPMTEADVRRHLARQTRLSVGLVDLVAMKSGRAAAELAEQRAAGMSVIALDVVDEETLQIAGRLIWESGGEPAFAVGSQGVEYALIAYWRSVGLIAPAGPTPRAGPADRMVVASGSCSPVTAEQIAWARDRGFVPVPIDAARAVDEAAWATELEHAVADALGHVSRGSDPILYTALGPDDPAVARFRTAVKTAGMDESPVNARVGDGLGRAVDRIIRAAGINRAVIAGGDTSSHAARTLSVFALTAMAPTVPGAALFKAHSEDPARAGLEIALKGGQMGSVDYFGLIKAGGIG
jgi:3-oxoisoapionate kinase